MLHELMTSPLHATIENSCGVLGLQENQTSTMHDTVFHLGHETLDAKCDTSSQPINSGLSVDLARISIAIKVPKCVINQYLHAIRKYLPDCDLPATATTLLQTPREANVVSMGSGKYAYYGLMTGVSMNGTANTRIYVFNTQKSPAPIAGQSGSHCRTCQVVRVRQ